MSNSIEVGNQVANPLKFKSFGLKKPYAVKIEEVKKRSKPGYRWYPRDVKGNVDEWAALIKHKEEAHHKDLL